MMTKRNQFQIPITKYGDYRLISLMSNALKILLRIIHNRPFKKCEAEIANNQFDFQGNIEKKETLFSLQVLRQKCLDQQKDIFLCFVDFVFWQNQNLEYCKNRIRYIDSQINWHMFLLSFIEHLSGKVTMTFALQVYIFLILTLIIFLSHHNLE